MFQKYVEAGYSVVPIVKGSRVPDVKWKKYQTQLPTLEEAARWDRGDYNIALVCGKVSGIVAVDIDDDNSSIIAILPPSPVEKRGKRGFTRFYRYNGETSKKLPPHVEILSDGCLTTIPPSIHPDTGAPYDWRLFSLFNTPRDSLPTLPDDFADQVAKVLNLPPKRTYNASFEDRETTPAEVRDALFSIRADCPYNEWIEIGMAIHSFMGASGFALWDEWSRGGNYPTKGQPHPRTHWNSFKEDAGIGIATLFHYARLSGWNPPAPNLPTPFIKPTPPIKPIPSHNLDLILNPPGLVGDIARWINETAIYRQPVLALAGAIAATGLIMAHKIKAPMGGLRTNMYTIGIAPSGAGKDHARKAIRSLLTKTGLDQHLMGNLVSHAGLNTGVSKTLGRTLCQPDEFGHVLKGMMNPKGASYETKIARVLMEIFTSSTDKYLGDEYANADGKRPRIDIEQPCLSVHATTVPSNFYAAMSSEEAVSGFLSRFLIFETSDIPIEKCGNGDVSNPPEKLIQTIKEWIKLPTNSDETSFLINPPTAIYDDGVESVIDQFDREIRIKLQNGGPTATILTRVGEHAKKLALLTTDQKITMQGWLWAKETAVWCADNMCAGIKENISDSERERESKKIMSIIRKEKKISREHLTYRTRNLDKKRREELVLELKELGLVAVENDGNKRFYISLD